MKIQIISALIAIYVTRVDAMTYANENGVSARQVETCDTAPQFKCSSDCSSILFCYSAGNPPVRIVCGANEQCVNGGCSSIPGTCAAESTFSNFLCTSIGYFPDPTNCTQYHVCREEGTNSILQRCPTGLIYNSNLVRCEIGQPRVDHAFKKICKAINCDKTRNGFMVFPANPAYYVNCSYDGLVQRMTMFKCNDVFNEVYDIALGTCVFKCKSKGYFVDPLDCSYYYVCSGRIKYTPIRVRCPQGLYFNGSACDVSPAQCPPDSIPTTTPITPPTVSSTTQTTSSTSPITLVTPPISLTGVSVDTENSVLLEQVTEATSKSPIFPFYSLWKHKGKYSIRLGKFLKLV